MDEVRAAPSRRELIDLALAATYLNLPDTTEAAFEFYKSVVGTECAGEGLMRKGDVPTASSAS